MANVVFAHGGKGGTGKSVISASLLDYCLSIDRPVGLIEGDPESPDVKDQFDDHVEYRKPDLSGTTQKDDAALQFLDAVNELSDEGCDIIVVNCPSNSSETIDAMADVIMGEFEESEHHLRVIYSLGEQNESTDGLRNSVESGLLSYLPSDNITISYNRRLGEPAYWHYVYSGTRDEIGLDFHEIEIPLLEPQWFAQQIFGADRPFYELIQRDCPVLKSSERQIFKRRFVKPMHEILASVLPPETHEAQEDSGDG